MSGRGAAARTLWVIDPSLGHPEDQGVGEVLHGWSGTSRLFQPGLRAGDGPAPETGYDTDGVVLLGSRASVYDDEPWLGPLSAWLRPLLDGSRGIPLLGVCFGHQLIAHLAGGEVGFVSADRNKLLGVEQTRLEGGRLIAGSHDLQVVISHREEVKTTPKGYRLVARRTSAPIDGLEHVDLPIFSFQFHPEARGDFARSAGIDPRSIDPGVVADGRRVLGAFQDLVRAG